MSIVRKGNRKPLWVHTVEGVLWRVVPTGRGVLVCETRDVEKKMTHFAGVNQTNGRLVWQNSSLGEQWWLGVEAVCGDVLLLHKFAKPDMPEHRGMLAVDVGSGQLLWQNDELKFQAAGDDFFVASQRSLTGEQFFQFDHRTARVLREVASRATEWGNISGRMEKQLFPLPLSRLEPENSAIAARIRSHCDAKNVVGAVEYIEHERALAFSFHERRSSSSDEYAALDHRLIILSNDDMIFSDIIKRNSPVFVPDSFFVENDLLFFVRERTKLTAVPL